MSYQYTGNGIFIEKLEQKGKVCQTKPDKKSTLIVKKRIYLLIQQACSLCIQTAMYAVTSICSMGTHLFVDLQNLDSIKYVEM